MENPHRVRARSSFIGIGVAFVFAVVLGLVRRSLPPAIDTASTLLGIMAVTVCYFRGIAAMCRLKGIAVWQGTLITVFLMVSSSLVRVLYKPAQFILWLMMVALPLYLSRLPDAPTDAPTPRETL
ncbi:MAG: hypothetical protein H7Y38_11805 [Armatimonadetes bacterium]|nr:hypothetical protein [Armatimonadota bacterium]